MTYTPSNNLKAPAVIENIMEHGLRKSHSDVDRLAHDILTGAWLYLEDTAWHAGLHARYGSSVEPIFGKEGK